MPAAGWAHQSHKLQLAVWAHWDQLLCPESLKTLGRSWEEEKTLPQRNSSSQICGDPAEEGRDHSLKRTANLGLVDTGFWPFCRSCGCSLTIQTSRHSSPRRAPSDGTTLPVTQQKYFFPPRILSSTVNSVQSHFTLHIYFQPLHLITTNLR